MECHEEKGERAWNGYGGFILGCVVSGFVSLLSYLRQLQEIRRVSNMNEKLIATLEEAHLGVPEMPPIPQAAEGAETYFFLAVITSLLFLSLRFLHREYKLLCKTRSKIFAASKKEAELEGQTFEHDPSTSRRLIKHFVMYRLDYWFSASVYSKPLTLLFLTLALIISGGILFYLVKQETVGSAMWNAWAFVADSGAHADESETGARVVGLMLTIGGMLVFALVIGLISDAISDKFDSLKRGKAKVIETDHTLILGWSDKTLPLIREIANANESLVKEGKLCVIAVLAEMDKEMMEQEIRDSNIDLRGSMVVCRRGNPTVLHDLQHVSARTARSVIVLSSLGMTADEADARSLRVVLCLVGLQYRQGHITVEIADVDNRELVHIIGGDRVETVVAHDFIGRLIVQSSRQPGLAPILERVLGFEGNEFYIQEWPDLKGKRFSEVLFSFEQAIPIGVRLPTKKDGSSGATVLNPADDFVIKDGMEIIVLAEDDDSYTLGDEGPYAKYPPLKTKKPLTPVRTIPRKERVLFIGWRRDLCDMLHELDEVVGLGSVLTIFSTVGVEERNERLGANGRTGHLELRNLTLDHVCGNPVSRREVELLPIEKYDSIFILADEEFESDMEAADGRSLTSLLLIHDIRNQRLSNGKYTFADQLGSSMNGNSQSTPKKVKKNPNSKFAVVSEVLDPKTRSLINLAKVSDYVMSNEMVSAALAMVAECREVNAILKELLSSDGNEIYVRPLEDYITPGRELSFWEMMSIVRTHGSILIGYRSGEDPVLNPEDKTEVRKWNKGEKLVLLAED